MLPWWFWFLLWTVLILLTLGAMVLGAIYLWRKAKGLWQEVGEAQSVLTAAYGQGEAVRAPEDAATSVPAGWDAVFSDPVMVRAQKEADTRERKARRRERRIASLWANGRPRRWGDVHDTED